MRYDLTPAKRPPTDPMEDLVFLGLAAFAVFTFAYDLALVMPLSLRGVSLISALACVLPVLAVARTTWGGVKRIGGHLRAHALDPAAWLLVGLCAVGGAVGMLTDRFDADDSFYLARAVLDGENWTAPIAGTYPFAFTDGAGGRFPSLPAWEHLWTAIAVVTGRPALNVYHTLAPLLGGVLVPFAWYCVLTRVSHARRGALAGVAAIVILMLLDGTTHRGIGNFGLMRIWQGKVVLIAAITPLALAVTLDVIRYGRAADWVRLVVLGVVGIGLSTTAAFFLPALVGLAGATFWLVYLPGTRIWQAPIASLAVFAYPALCVLPFYRALVGPDAIFASVIASDLHDVLVVVYGSPISPLVMAFAFALVGLAAGGRTRLLGWFALWTALIAVPLAWPPSADFIVTRMTSADALWRLAYAGPVILAVGAGIGAMMEVSWLRLIAVAVLLAGGTVSVGLALRKAPPSPFAEAGVRFPAYGPKVPAEALAAARGLVAALPPGTMLAPRELSVVIPLISSKQRLSNFREFDAAPQLVIDGRAAIGEDLTRAHDFVSGLGTTPAHKASFERIAKMGLGAIVLAPTVSAFAGAEGVLAGAGYREVAPVAVYRVFVRGAG